MSTLVGAAAAFEIGSQPPVKPAVDLFGPTCDTNA